jgi:hypothetical protein
VSAPASSGKQDRLPCAAAVSCVAVWCKMALDTPSLQVGHGHVGSMGFKSFACFLSSDASKMKEGHSMKIGLTKINWPIECQSYAEPGCSRRKNTVCLWGKNQTLGSALESLRGPTISTPNATQTRRSWGPQQMAYLPIMAHLQRSLYPSNTSVLSRISITAPGPTQNTSSLSVGNFPAH